MFPLRWMVIMIMNMMKRIKWGGGDYTDDYFYKSKAISFIMNLKEMYRIGEVFLIIIVMLHIVVLLHIVYSQCILYINVYTVDFFFNASFYFCYSIVLDEIAGI